MLHVRQILATVDLTDEGRFPLRYAGLLAERSGADLHVFYADVLHGPLHGADAPARSHEEIVARMKELTEGVLGGDAERGGVTTRYAVERNVYPAPAILEYAESHDVDLIVMGTHGRRGVSRLVLGSVAEEVVRRAKCTVLTVRAPRGDEPESIEIASVLVPFDFSAHSQSALTHGKALADTFGARVDMLHVVEERLHPAFYGITVQSIYDVDPNIERKSVEHMTKAFESVGSADVTVTYEARPGSPAREIVRYAEGRGSSLIIMGTHGLTGLDHFLLGSTTERVLRRAGCPVMALKSDDVSWGDERSVSENAST